ncbi:hypothetical protein [Cellulosilyticum ruminicola]|uniref:hypothetical protein n=1 Tax=Cellulosilyticum ruminicola TaxID=425254 RepID=UPI0006D0EFB1|nr:hypothetical protein [Cellulosilyticum ruminicola]
MEQALIALYEEKEIYQISVKELCSRAAVARSTFYTYYNVIDDCLIDIENRLIGKLIEMNEALLMVLNIIFMRELL